jgi:hypothetical protein
MEVVESGQVAAHRAARWDLASRVPAFVWIPPARWPLRWHAAVAVAVILAMALGAFLWRRELVRDYREAARALRKAEAELSQIRREPQPAPAPMPALADASSVENVVRDVGQFALPRSVKIASVQIEYELERGPAGTQVRVLARAHGEYSALKSWLGELLARYPALAVSSLTLRPAADQKQLDATVAFALFLKAPR